MGSGFRAEPIDSGIYQIWAPGGVSCFLAIGRSQALLMDTGYGLGDLRSFLGTLTDLPIVVVNSHGHIDHVGGNFHFEFAFLHPADFDLARRHTQAEERANALGFLGISQSGYASFGSCPLRSLLPGQRFELGDRIVDTLACPGHTAGSVALYDRQTGVLLAGDSFSRHVWLFDEDSTSISEFLRSIRRAQAIDPSAIYCSHSPERMQADFLERLALCALNISFEKSRAFAVPLAGAEALIYAEGGELFVSPDFVSIVYSPKKLDTVPSIAGSA